MYRGGRSKGVAVATATVQNVMRRSWAEFSHSTGTNIENAQHLVVARRKIAQRLLCFRGDEPRLFEFGDEDRDPEGP